LDKIFVTDEAIEKTKQKFSCTDEAIKSAQICEFLDEATQFLDNMIFPAMKQYNRSNFVL
jgi:hypothetical protein